MCCVFWFVGVCWLDVVGSFVFGCVGVMLLWYWLKWLNECGWFLFGCVVGRWIWLCICVWLDCFFLSVSIFLCLLFWRWGWLWLYFMVVKCYGLVFYVLNFFYCVGKMEVDFVWLVGVVVEDEGDVVFCCCLYEVGGWICFCDWFVLVCCVEV